MTCGQMTLSTMVGAGTMRFLHSTCKRSECCSKAHVFCLPACVLAEFLPPGKDGAKGRRRFERVQLTTCQPLPADGIRPASMAALKRCLLRALTIKGDSPACTEGLIEQHLLAVKEEFTDPITASQPQKDAAPYLPTTYKEVLTVLEDMQLVTFPRDWLYDICSACAFPFRGAHCSPATTPRCPDCGRLRSSKSDPVLKLIVRDPRDFARVRWRHKRSAKLLKDWPNWRNQDTAVLEDAPCGRLWDELVDQDSKLWIPGTKVVFWGHMILYLAADGYQVRTCSCRMQPCMLCATAWRVHAPMHPCTRHVQYRAWAAKLGIR